MENTSDHPNLPAGCASRLSALEDAVRKSPLESVGIALFAGVVLRLLPIAAILGMVIRLALVLAKPAAIGVLLWQVLKRADTTTRA